MVEAGSYFKYDCFFSNKENLGDEVWLLLKFLPGPHMHFQYMVYRCILYSSCLNYVQKYGFIQYHLWMALLSTMANFIQSYSLLVLLMLFVIFHLESAQDTYFQSYEIFITYFWPKVDLNLDILSHLDLDHDHLVTSSFISTIDIMRTFVCPQPCCWEYWGHLCISLTCLCDCFHFAFKRWICPLTQIWQWSFQV